MPCPIIYEASNQPVADDSERASRLRKRPDFQCGYHDDLADNAEESELFYTIECKRLGLPSRSDWVLNLNYVVNGIDRFIRAESGYATGVSSGLMIGYLQSMDPEAILSEVNQNAASRGVPAITLAPRNWTTRGLTVLNPHLFPRDVEPRIFRLSHHWIDLRHLETFKAASNVPPKKSKKRLKRNPGADSSSPESVCPDRND